ncbi:MAG TPA: 2'-5' RNA ligase family protein, partial [Tepidisphaeraceae bacterium]|nr:2'-5' RNA ligase family protein [Tepidisphaeraceae bacterium]
VFATLLFTSFSTIPLGASQCEAARVICGPGATGERMGFAVEMYFDEKTEKTLRDLRKTLTEAGIRPVLDEMGDRPHISLAVFSQVDVDVLLEELEKFAGETRAMPMTLSAIGAFATAEAVLFLTPAITQELLDVHWDFHQMLGDLKMHPHAYYQPDRWVPHSTIAQNVEEGMVGKAFDVLRKSFKPISGKLVEMGLVRFRPVESLGCYQLSRA